MAWFKFGKQETSVNNEAPVETVETLRSRAKRRLIGALILVVIAVAGFPLLFDTQPRPLLVDVPIEIPDKNKVKPLSPPPASTSKPAAAAKVDDSASLGGKEEIVNPSPVAVGKNKEKEALGTASTAQSATKTVASPTPDKTAKDKVAAEKATTDKAAADKATAARAEADKTASEKAAAEKAAAEKSAATKAAADKTKAETAKAEAAKAQSLLDGKATPAAAETSERFIVQFGSFAEVEKARQARQKVEKAGLKTYAQIAETAEGKRYRVRVGPFATRAEADKAAAKIKGLDLPANILTL
jgi:DedD protein